MHAGGMRLGRLNLLFLRIPLRDLKLVWLTIGGVGNLLDRRESDSMASQCLCKAVMREGLVLMNLDVKNILGLSTVSSAFLRSPFSACHLVENSISLACCNADLGNILSLSLMIRLFLCVENVCASEQFLRMRRVSPRAIAL